MKVAGVAENVVKLQVVPVFALDGKPEFLRRNQIAADYKMLWKLMGGPKRSRPRCPTELVGIEPLIQ